SDAPARYFVVDIGTGRRWLMSRVLLFTFVLWKIGAIRCVVFVERRDQYMQRFLGIAPPDVLCSVIGAKYPWLDQALVAAWALKTEAFEPNDLASLYPKAELSLVSKVLPKDQAENLVKRFMKVKWVRRATPPDEQHGDWELLSSGPTRMWERTKWVTK